MSSTGTLFIIAVTMQSSIAAVTTTVCVCGCVSGWFMTVFSAMDVLSYDHACAVLDLFLVDGWKALFRVSLAMLAAVEDVLLYTDFGTIVRYLNTYPRNRVPDVPTLISSAMAFKVTNK